MPIRYWLPLPLVLLAAGLGYAILSLPEHTNGLQSAVAAKMGLSGVTHPVTAVLLNFRGYDTLLEMMVLLLALLAVWSLDGPALYLEAAPNGVLDTLARLLTPVLILTATYLLWVGAHAPGGAFQAGSVLGATGVLLLLAGWRFPNRLAQQPLRLALVAGPAAFIAIAALTLLWSGRLLEYPPAQAGALILMLESFAMLSIGVTLAALFLGAEPGHKKKP